MQYPGGSASENSAETHGKVRIEIRGSKIMTNKSEPKELGAHGCGIIDLHSVDFAASSSSSSTKSSCLPTPKQPMVERNQVQIKCGDQWPVANQGEDARSKAKQCSFPRTPRVEHTPASAGTSLNPQFKNTKNNITNTLAGGFSDVSINANGETRTRNIQIHLCT